ncbi:MAG: L,D-transpeptidase [Jatrophihabitantaceae bacterium]
MAVQDARPARARRRLTTTLVAAAVALVGLSACTTAGPRTRPPGTPVAHTSAQQATGSLSRSPDGAPAAVISTSPASSTPLNPTTPVQVSVANGKLTAVRMVNETGKLVTGTLAANGSSWKTNEDLGYSKTYTVSAVAVNSGGVRTVKTSRFTTLTPANMTMPYLNTIYGSSLTNGGTYGVGMVAVVHFDEHISDRAAAERALKVTTTPQVEGSWYWLDDQNVHWRPRSYYQPGTKVTIAADVYGVEVGQGLYGQSDQSVSFTIGAKHISIADASTHQVKVYFNDQLVRTMPTSMGQGGYVRGTYGKIALWTMPGIYTVLGHENPATMSSDSYGLPSTSAYGYPPEKVPYSTKISTDGIYLHELDTTVWAQGHQNVSHGCLNLNRDNAKFYYNTSQVGDVVEVVHSGGPGITVQQGGDWSVPWSTWTAGSALH